MKYSENNKISFILETMNERMNVSYKSNKNGTIFILVFFLKPQTNIIQSIFG